MNKIILFFAILVTLISCQAVLGTIYGTNKHLVFESKETAATYLHKKNKLDREKVFFFKNDKARTHFMMSEQADMPHLPYYALMASDSAKVDDSRAGDKSCIGTVDKFVLDYHKDSAVLVPKDLRWLEVANYKGETLNLNAGAPTLVFVISTNLGRVINTTANYVTDHINEHGKPVNYVYIFMDYIPDGDHAS